MSDRNSAVSTAVELVKSGVLIEKLARRVEIRSESQDPDVRSELYRYLNEEIIPDFQQMGFTHEIFENPIAHGGPILIATRIEDASLPTVICYGHGDVQPGRPEGWDARFSPWKLTRDGERLYGRGTADNKGQHTVVISSLGTVLRERGRLGFNVKFFMEMSEEIGSVGIGEFVESHKELLAADLFIGCDGPRTNVETPSVRLGSRGYKAFSLNVNLRDGSRHSGHWAGIVRDPGILLAHALSSLMSADGRILVEGWLPKSIDPRSRKLLEKIPFDAKLADSDWGEPGLTPLEKTCVWTSFSVTAFRSGNIDKPGSEIQGQAKALCNIRYTVDVDGDELLPALRRHLDGHGFDLVEIKQERTGTGVLPARTDPDDPWVHFCVSSLERTLGKSVMLLPNGSGTLPSCYFQYGLGVPVIWIPHSYPECGQHGPNEHTLVSLLEESMALMTGLFWDIGDRGKMVADRYKA